MKVSKAFIVRLFWFGIGGLASIAVNTGLFRLFHSHFGWDSRVAYALSLAIITALLFLWNYVVGFKTEAHWTVSARRQVICTGVSIALNYALVMAFQGLFPRWPEVVIAVVQVFIALFKFVLYHYWVYPQRETAFAVEKAARTP